MRGGASAAPWDSSLGHGPSTPSLCVGHQGPSTRSPGFSVCQRGPSCAAGGEMLGQHLALRAAPRTLSLFLQSGCVGCSGPHLASPPLQAGKPRTENLRTHTCNPPGALAGRKQLRLAAGGASPVPCRKPLGRQADLGRGCVPLPLSRKKDLLSRGGSRLSPRSQSPSSEPGSWACAQRSCLAQAAVRLAAAGGAEGG